MNTDIQQKLAIERAENLLRQRKKILGLPPEKALDAILDSPQPAALVHSCSEEDLYFLIHDIGPEDSLQLLSLASNRQWAYILDIETWEKDRLEISSVTRWLHLLLKADPNRLVQWAINEKSDFIEHYLFKTIEVRIRDHDQDPSEFGEDFFTYDDTFYVRFIKDPLVPEPDGSIRKTHQEEFLSQFLERLAGFDYSVYQNVLLESSNIIPAESEEEAYRLRNVRLGEKGFLPFDEAIGIYQPLSPDDLENQGIKSIKVNSNQEVLLPVPLYHGGMLEEDNLFAGALKLIDTNQMLHQIQTEFAGLCNQIIAADQKTIRGRAELKNIVKKACGYISIGLEGLAPTYKKRGPGFTAALIQKFPLSAIFRVGFGLSLEVKWRAEKWRVKSWFVKQELPLSFWGEEWIGVLGGLLIKKPLYFDNYRTGGLYREFLGLSEVKATEDVLDEIIAFDGLLFLMNIKIETGADQFLTYKSLILTLWARHHLKSSEKLIPLTLDEFRAFFNDLWTAKSKPPKIRLCMKESFLNWLSERIGLDPYEITPRVGQTLENLFKEIETEYGDVAAKDLDSRYIHLFLLEKPKE
ncbi:MAG: hypothetical protein JRF71_00035 [Deltaproteobacteria bacterium]|nr:hypothetical protein [Deltaproteobacteria bacterium]